MRHEGEADVPTDAAARAVRAAEDLYAAIDDEFGLLSSADVGRLMGSRSETPRAMTHCAHKAGRLVGLHRGRTVVFPGFQFDDDGHPLPVIAALRASAEERERSEAATIQWLCSPTTYFDGLRPVDHLRLSPADVQVAASAAWDVEW